MPTHSPTRRRRGSIIENIVTALIGLAILFFVILMLMPSVGQSRGSARRSSCKNNLKAIMMAVHNYHDTYGAMPPAFTVDADGRKLHSWRVLLLPFLEQKDLYDKIDLTKPWDDPVNDFARQQAISVYRCPANPAPSNHTTYLAIVGDNYAFSPDGVPRKFSDIRDGLSNTVIMMEVNDKQTVEWMSPVDTDDTLFLSFGPKTPKSHQGVIMTGFGDGGIQALSENLPTVTRQALLTINGGEVVKDF